MREGSGCAVVPHLKFKTNEGGTIQLPADVSRCVARSDAASRLNQILLSICMLSADANGVQFTPICPVEPESAPDEFEVSRAMLTTLDLLPYAGDLSRCLSCHTSFRTANRNHPLVLKALEANFSEHPSGLSNFASILVGILSNSDKAAGRPVPPEISLEAMLENPLRSFSLKYKYVGVLFQRLLRAGVAEEFAPPYWIRLESGRRVEITAQVLKRWAAMEEFPEP